MRYLFFIATYLWNILFFPRYWDYVMITIELVCLSDQKEPMLNIHSLNISKITLVHVVATRQYSCFLCQNNVVIPLMENMKENKFLWLFLQCYIELVLNEKRKRKLMQELVNAKKFTVCSHLYTRRITYMYKRDINSNS